MSEGNRMRVKRAGTVAFEPVVGVPGLFRQVLLGAEDGMPHFFLRRFRLAPGAYMPLHTNDVEHEQYVLKGRARVTIGNQQVEVAAGDVVYIPGGVPHDYRTLSEDGPFEFLCAVPNQPDRLTMLGIEE